MRYLNEKISATDGIGQPWAKTEILCGYGYHHSDDKFTLSYLDEEIFEPIHNMVPISGVQTLLQMAFGVRGPIIMDTLYTKFGIGIPDEEDTPQFLVPENDNTEGGATKKNSIYAPGHLIQLYGIGLTGAGENSISVRKTGYRETDIQMNIKEPDGTILQGMMIPFRFTDAQLDPNERQIYFGKKFDQETGKTGYYLKRFESTPEIKHIWRSKDTNAGSRMNDVEATNETIWDQTRDDAIKSLVEFHIKISANDVKEFFEYKFDQMEASRFNTLALFAGKYSEKGKKDSDQFGDYCNVTLFSKLAVPTEPLSLEKDLEFIYRVYGS